MIADILFYVLLPTVILIVLIGLLYLIYVYLPSRYPDGPDGYDDDDYYYDDDDYFPSEYTIEHVTMLKAMEDDVAAFMERQNQETREYLNQMAA